MEKSKKMINFVLLSSTMTFRQSALNKLTFMIFGVINVRNNTRSPFVY